MGFPRQEYWRGLPFPPPGDLLNPEIESMSPESTALQADSLLMSHWGSPWIIAVVLKCILEVVIADDLSLHFI